MWTIAIPAIHFFRIYIVADFIFFKERAEIGILGFEIGIGKTAIYYFNFPIPKTPIGILNFFKFIIVNMDLNYDPFIFFIFVEPLNDPPKLLYSTPGKHYKMESQNVSP